MSPTLKHLAVLQSSHSNVNSTPTFPPAISSTTQITVTKPVFVWQIQSYLAGNFPTLGSPTRTRQNTRNSPPSFTVHHKNVHFTAPGLQKLHPNSCPGSPTPSKYPPHLQPSCPCHRNLHHHPIQHCGWLQRLPTCLCRLKPPSKQFLWPLDKLWLWFRTHGTLVHPHLNQ